MSQLPTGAQIRAITDAAALEALRDEIELAATRIEADLDFREGTGPDWESRALSALAHHRNAARMIGRRLEALEEPIKPKAPTTRSRDECSQLALELLEGGFGLNAAEIRTEADADRVLGELLSRRDALELDRADEVSLPLEDRDVTWLARAKVALRRAGEWRQRLQVLKSDLREASRMAAHDERSNRQQQVFVDVARDHLSADQYAELWRFARLRMNGDSPFSALGAVAPPFTDHGKGASDA